MQRRDESEPTHGGASKDGIPGATSSGSLKTDETAYTKELPEAMTGIVATELITNHAKRREKEKFCEWLEKFGDASASAPTKSRAALRGQSDGQGARNSKGLHRNYKDVDFLPNIPEDEALSFTNSEEAGAEADNSAPGSHMWGLGPDHYELTKIYAFARWLQRMSNGDTHTTSEVKASNLVKCLPVRHSYFLITEAKVYELDLKEVSQWTLTALNPSLLLKEIKPREINIFADMSATDWESISLSLYEEPQDQSQKDWKCLAQFNKAASTSLRNIDLLQEVVTIAHGDNRQQVSEWCEKN